MIKVDHAAMAITPLPEDTYHFKVSELKKQKAKSSENQVVLVTAIVLESNEPELVGKKVLDNFPLVESALWRLNGLYHACMGEPLPEGDYDEDTLYEEVVTQIKGADFISGLTIDTYQGQKRNRFANFAIENSDAPEKPKAA